MELVVAMAIGATVLMLAYGGFQILAKTSSRVSSLRNSQLIAENAISRIYSDFYSSEEIKLLNNEILFLDQHQITSYKDFGSGVIRIQQNVRDTFPALKISLNNNDLIINYGDQDPIVLQWPASAFSNLPPIEN